MSYLMYTIKDVLAGTFTDIKLFTNEALAKRWFKGLCAESKIAVDLQLFYLGTYCVDTGAIKSKVKFVEGGVLNE